MIRILFLVEISLVSLSLFAQNDKEIPVFGKVDKMELEMTECDFDKNAEAVVLFDLATNTSESKRVNLERHVRIKILKAKGLNKADIHLPYHHYGNDETIKNLEAQTFNLDASGNIVVTPVDKNLIYEVKLNKRYSEKVFTFPEVKVGSVIEYKYTLQGAGLMNWYFQKSIPVKHSRFIIDFPKEYEISAQTFCSLPVESEQKNSGNFYTKTFTMRDVPALRDEPFISCEGDYMQRVETKLISLNYPGIRIDRTLSWGAIVRLLMDDEDFGLQLKKNIPRTSALDSQLNNLKDAYQRMVAVHHYVRKNMDWNGYYGIWASDGVKKAWKEKKGTAGEINLILVNLLKDAGLEAHPILVSTRENGRIQIANPTLRQFNKVMAFVKINNKKYILDASDKHTPTQLIPYEVMYSEGLVIKKQDVYEWTWETLWDEKQQFKNVTIFDGNISEQGQMTGEASVTSYDYTRLSRTLKLKDGKDKFTEEYFTNIPGIKVDRLEIENAEVDSLPLKQKVRFTQSISSTGNYQYFSANIFTGLERNPFVADTRFSDVFFAATQQYIIVGSFRIPESYVFEELPKNIRMIMPDSSISITRWIAAENNQLSVRINLDFKKPFYSTEEYPDFKEFYKKLFVMMNEQFVIKRKATL